MKAETLKKSILQYAMQGKLVEQNPDDEPASELLKKIKAEKEQLIKEGKIKKEKPLPLITDDEIPYKLPQGWEWARVKDLSLLYNGKAFKPSDWSKKGLPIVRIQNLNNIFAEYNYYNGFVEDTYLLNGGELLFAWSGTPGTSFGAHIWKGGKAVLNQHIFKMVFNETLIYKKFLMHALNQRIEELISKAHGAVGLQHVTKGVFENTLLPLPPLAEQQRIVEKLEQILPLIEEYGKNEEKLSELNKTLPDKIKQSILQHAVQGKLVPQNPTDEPASELLKRIISEKEQLIKDGKIKKEKSLPSISKDEIPYKLPDNWTLVRLGDLCTINPRNSVEDEMDVGFIPMTLINDGYLGGHSFETRKWKSIKSGFTHFQTHDIVVAKITPCFQNRKSTIIAELPNNIGAGTTELHVIRDNTHILNMKYLLIILKTEMFIQEGVKKFTGTAGQQRIGRDFITNYIIPLPPLAEQQRIVEKVEELIFIADSLKA